MESFVFSFNWTYWSFAECGEGQPLRDRMPQKLELDLIAWGHFMQNHFRLEEDGSTSFSYSFSSPEAEDWANEEYARLCRCLAEETDIVFTTDNWWSKGHSS